MSTVVMVVDDSATVRVQVGKVIAEAGLEVLEAVDGQDALEKLVAGPVPSLLICDVNMPNMNGLELLEEIAAMPLLASMAIVMLTTEGEPAMIRRARSLGAKGWLVKPVRPDLLLDAVTQLIEVNS